MNEAKKNKPQINLAISYLHIIGMVMILLCHYLQNEKIYFLSEIFISGVPLFLFVAGYLSGKSRFTTVSDWFSKKVKRILVPFWIFVIVVYGLYEILKLSDISGFQWVFSLLNLQGLNYSFWKFEYFGAVAGCGHLWYLTTLMFCYLLVPLMRKVNIAKLSTIRKTAIVICLVLFQVGAMYIGFQLSYIIVFFIGFFVARTSFDVNGKTLFALTMFTGALAVDRILLRGYLDNTDIYNRFISLTSCAAIGIWIFYFVYFINEKFPRFTEKLNCAPVRFLEKISYYVYITHYIFLRGPFSVSEIVENKALFYIVVTVLSFLSATVLYLITEKGVLKLAKRKK